MTDFFPQFLKFLSLIKKQKQLFYGLHCVAFAAYFGLPSLPRFLADRTNGRAIGTVLRLSVCLSVCDVMYCG